MACAVAALGANSETVIEEAEAVKNHIRIFMKI
jgi:hypothetical protein